MAAPLLLSAAMLAPFDNKSPLLAFIILMVPGCLISYGATTLLFLPSLFFLSRNRQLTTAKVCLIGLALGALAFIPLTWLAWTSSGPDSGPPTESFLTFLPRWVADPLTLTFPAAGTLTAFLYWRLGTWRRRQPNLPTAAI